MKSLGAACLIGGNREALVPDMIRSCDDWVDGWVVIRTDATADKAIGVARSMIAPERLTVVNYPGEFRWCFEGRNFSVDQTHAAGFDWAMIIDTDERMCPGDTEVRKALNEVDVDVLLTENESGEYPKVRFIRAPRVGSYKNRVHEIYTGANTLGMLEGFRFSEIPKTPEQEFQSMTAVRNTCRQWIIDEPDYSRAWLHLANTDVFVEHFGSALRNFLKCAELTEYDEERAWALYRAAGCLEEMGQHRDAIEVCAAGMVACPYFPELPFLASWCASKLNRNFDALAWSQMAIATGKMSQVPVVTPIRSGFNIPIANWEGPWDIRAATLEVMGLEELARQSREMYDKAKAARERTLRT